jgi:maltose O-acetyltransferase
MPRTEKEKMLAGETYYGLDPDLEAERQETKALLRLYNLTEAVPERQTILQQMLGQIGQNSIIEPPFYCVYGQNIHIGDYVFLNFSCTILDCNEVHIGHHVMIGPAVQIYTAAHLLQAEPRIQGWEVAKPIVIEDNVWLGGGAILLPGVRIGRNAVVSFGAVHGGRAYNVIPDEVELNGTVRSLNPEVREQLRSRIEEITRGVVTSLGLDYQYEFEYGYPVLINDSRMSGLVVSTCSRAIGKENVVILPPSMGAEDFAYFLEKCPGAMFRLGVRNEEKGLIQPHHNTLFNIDEEVLPFGVEVFVRLIDEFLG